MLMEASVKKKSLSVAGLALLIPVMMLAAPPRLAAQTQPVDQTKPVPVQYVPQAQFCADGTSSLCSVLPAYIGPDSRLKLTIGYNGLYGAPPKQASADVQTPFDNMAWQMFVALNWAAGAVNKPPATGLTAAGPRVWQTYRKVSALFGNSPVRAPCTQQIALPRFYIGSDGKGNPAPNNEEYLQASTNLPLIDINGNWTAFCKSVTVGLVGLHILQRNPVDPNNPALLPQWIWATFEHADNAPLAQLPCNVSDGCGTVKATDWINQASCGSAAAVSSVRYSFFNQNQPGLGTNIAPAPPTGAKTQYPWSPQQPFAGGGTTPATAMPQATRCWQVYPTTDQLNTQWRQTLGALGSVFGNYMLIGTQWGGQLEPPTPPNPVPANAVPGMLSNMTLETYIQNYTGSDPKLPGPGSCVSCHGDFAKLPADRKISANFSFLPGLANPATARSQIKTAR
jgi:hypothetical protein